VSPASGAKYETLTSSLGTDGYTSWGRIDSGQGRNYIVLQGNESVLSQHLIGLDQGRRYVLSLLTTRPPGNLSAMGVTLTAGTQTMVDWVITPKNTEFARYTVAFDAVSTLARTTLAIRTIASGDEGTIFVDAVTLCDTCIVVHNAGFEENDRQVVQIGTPVRACVVYLRPHVTEPIRISPCHSFICSHVILYAVFNFRMGGRRLGKLLS
jgi:hypothetical protein